MNSDPDELWMEMRSSASRTQISPHHYDERDRENARLRLALQEQRHRFKNQWQLLIGLTELEKLRSPQHDAASGLVRLHALVHAFVMLNSALETGLDVVCSAAIDRIGARAALESILTPLQATVPKGNLSFVVEDAWLSEKECTALLLICAELVCNATKHGRKTTHVTFNAHGNQGMLEVRDDGPGFPEGFCIQTQEGQGLQLLESLCRFDLQGEMRCRNVAQGGSVVVTFPVTAAREETLL